MADGDAGGRRLVVATLLYDGFTALDAIGPSEVLCRVPDVSLLLVAKRRGPVRTDTGAMAVVADRALREIDQVDVLVVPGAGTLGVTGAIGDAETMDWVRRVHEHTLWTTSVCTGALLLGAAGLLRGLPATTHWASLPALESVAGAVPTAGRFVESGKIITAAGVSAGVDMALYLASRLAGDEVAEAMQLAVEYDPHPPFDAGTPEKAGRQIQQLALRLMRDAAR